MATTYTCEGCAKTLTATPEEAFELGWDTPERFMSHTTCESCPISSTLWWRIVVLKQTDLTPADGELLQEYNRIFTESQRNGDCVCPGHACVVDCRVCLDLAPNETCPNEVE